MERLAHLARWKFADGSEGYALLGPYRASFIRDTATWRVEGKCSWHQVLKITTFNEVHIGNIKRVVGDCYGFDICTVCNPETPDSAPCWYWRPAVMMKERYGSLGTLRVTPQAIPPNELQIATRVDTIQQLIEANAELREQFAANAFVATPRPSRRSRGRNRYTPVEEFDDDFEIPDPIQQVVTPPRTVVPTPTGTIRCTHCGQIIPPGFTKETDPRKTEDEIYRACSHDFDERNICKKCKLPKRDEGTRFSLLEVD